MLALIICFIIHLLLIPGRQIGVYLPAMRNRKDIEVMSAAVSPI